ncbi:hypothetical protein [Rhizobacter fulvus]
MATVARLDAQPLLAQQRVAVFDEHLVECHVEALVHRLQREASQTPMTFEPARK